MCVFASAHLLKFICNPKIDTHSALWSCKDTHERGRSSHQRHGFPAEAEQGNALPSRFSPQMVNKGPSWGLFSAKVFHTSVLFVDGICLEWPQARC